MRPILRQLIVFLAVGLLNTGTTLTVIVSLIYWLQVQPLLANFIGYAIGLLLSFSLNRSLTFKDQGRLQRTGSLFLLAAGIAYGLNVAAMLLAEKRMGVNIYLAQVLGNIVYTGTFFVLCRWMVFVNSKASDRSFPERASGQIRQKNAGRWWTKDTGISVIKSLIIAALTLWLIDTEGFNPLDDHQFARTLFKGHPFGAYFSQELGRFYPLVAQEYVLVSWLLGHESQLFYRIGILKLAALGWILSLAISGAGLRGWLSLLLWLLGIFSFGVAGTLFRLHAGDLNATLLLLGYLTWSALPPATEKLKRGRLFAGVFLAILASFYKESIAVLLLIYSGTELLRMRLQHQWQQAPRSLPVFIYATAYLLVYKFWAGHPTDANYALTHHLDRLEVMLHFLTNNPSMFALYLPTLLFRMLKNGADWKSYRVFDSMLLAGLGYMLLFVSLGMFNLYYLLPGEALALVGLAGTLAHLPAKDHIQKVTAFLAILLLTENAPAIVSELSYQRQIVINHGRFLSFMRDWSPLHCGDPGPRCTLELEGLRGGYPEIPVSLQSFMEFVAPHRFLIREEPNGASDRKSPLPHLPEAPALVLVNPYRAGPEFLEKPSLKRLFSSGDLWAAPPWRLHEWLKHCGFSSDGKCRIRLGQDSRYAGYRIYQSVRPAMPTASTAPLQHPAYQIHGANVASVMRRASFTRITFQIQNLGKESWGSDVAGNPGHPVHLAYRWMDAAGKMIREGGRTPLPETILSGEFYDTAMIIESPQQIGLYRLEIVPVQEGVLWFPPAFTQDILIQ